MLSVIADVLGVEISAFVTRDDLPAFAPDAVEPPSRPEMLSRLTSAFQAMHSDADRYRVLLWVEALVQPGSKAGQ